MATSAETSAGSSSGSSQPQVQASSAASSSDTAQTTTVNTPTTTSSPPSSSPAATTTPVGSTPTSSPAAAQTTSPAAASTFPGASSASVSAAASSSLISSTFTSQVATTFSSTNSVGSIIVVTTTYPEIVSTAVSTSGSHTSGSSHTGVIVGSVVGGVAGIALIALLLFCIRQRVRQDEFDGNFDPDHVVGRSDGGGAGTLPHVDIADEITPFPQAHVDHGSMNGSMRQYGEPPYLAVPTSPSTASGQFSGEFYPQVAMDAQPRSFMQPGAGPPSGAYQIPPVNLYGAGPVDWHRPRPGTSPPPSTVSNNTGSSRAAKEREAAGRQGAGLGLATQPEAGEGSGDVIVHQDAGRAPSEEQAPPREIPPSYDSIRD